MQKYTITLILIFFSNSYINIAPPFLFQWPLHTLQAGKNLKFLEIHKQVFSLNIIISFTL